MSPFTRPLLALLAVPMLLCGGAAVAPPSAEAAGVPGVRVDLLIDGRLAQEYYANERIYVEAKKGREYAIRLSNDTPERVAVALAVDGLNTIDASHTAAKDAPKWVLSPYETVTVSGWQVSTEHARRFVFTSEERSYGAWVGDTRNLGLISAVVFGERTRCCREPVPYTRRSDDNRDWEAREGAASADEAPRAGTGKSAPARGEAPASEPSADASGARSGSSRGSSTAQRWKNNKQEEERAATGSGRRLQNEVVWTEFDLEPRPIGSVDVRYGFRDELVELGVLPPPHRALDRREAAAGFAPDPGGRCCR
jgi:hypothetical protein